MKKRDVIILHKLQVSIHTKRDQARPAVWVFERKYAVHKTGKNFIRAAWSEIEKLGDEYHGLTERVPLDSLMKVSEPGLYDQDDVESVRRTIYYLSDDRDRAIYEIKKAIDDRVKQMKQQMDALYDAWVNRKVK